MTGMHLLAFVLGGACGYLLAIWTSRQTLATLHEQLEELHAQLLAERKARFTPQWQRLRPTQPEVGQ